MADGTSPEAKSEKNTEKKTKKGELRGLYDRYLVTIEFTSNLEGGVPTTKELIRAWTAAGLKKKKRDYTQEELDKLVDETMHALPKHALDEVTDAAIEAKGLYNSFKRDASGNVVLETRCIKSFFKENGNILKERLKDEAKLQGREEKRYNLSYMSRIAEEVFIESNEVPFYRDGEPLGDVDGFEEKPIHVKDKKTGQMNAALKRYDFVRAGVTLEFVVRRLADGNVHEHDLLRILEHGQENGLGSGRSQGNGRFRVISIDQLESTQAMPLFIKRPTAKKAEKVEA